MYYISLSINFLSPPSVPSNRFTALKPGTVFTPIWPEKLLWSTSNSLAPNLQTLKLSFSLNFVKSRPQSRNARAARWRPKTVSPVLSRSTKRPLRLNPEWSREREAVNAPIEQPWPRVADWPQTHRTTRAGAVTSRQTLHAINVPSITPTLRRAWLPVIGDAASSRRLTSMRYYFSV